MEHPSDLIQEIRLLRSENAELVGRLDHATAKIMSLQGSNDYITDDEVEQQVGKLYSAIQTWVEGIEKDFMLASRKFQQDFDNLIEYEADAERLLDVGLRGEQAPWDERNIEFKKMAWLAGHESCLYVYLSRLIWQRLYEEIFDTPYPFGIPDEALEGFDYIIEALSHERGEKDFTIEANKWRSETISKIVPTKSFKINKEHRIQDLLEFLKKELAGSPILLDAKVSLPKRLKTLETTIIRPAVALKQAMACSPFEYRIEEPDELHYEHNSKNTSLLQWTLKDVVKWRKPDSPTDVGGTFLCLFPAVTRGAVGKEGDLALVKPLVLVHDKEASQQIQEYLRPRRNQRSTPKSDEDLPCSPTPSPLSSRSSTVKSVEEPQHMTKRDWRKGAMDKVKGVTNAVLGKHGNETQRDSASRPRASRRKSHPHVSNPGSGRVKKKPKGVDGRPQELDRCPTAGPPQKFSKPKSSPDGRVKDYDESETRFPIRTSTDVKGRKPEETSQGSPAPHTPSDQHSDFIIVEEESEHYTNEIAVALAGPARTVGVNPNMISAKYHK